MFLTASITGSWASAATRQALSAKNSPATAASCATLSPPVTPTTTFLCSNSPMRKEYIFIFGGEIGGALLGIHLGQVLAEAAPGSRLTLLSTKKSSFTGQLAALVPEVSYREMPKNSIGSWLFLAPPARHPPPAPLLRPLLRT